MNFEQPEKKEDISGEEVEERKSLSEIDKEDLSQVEETKEFQEIMDLYDKGIELMESRKKADGLGVLSKIGLNKDFESLNAQYEELINKLKEKKEALSEEIDMKEPFFEFFITTALKKRFINKMHKEEGEGI